MNLTVSGFAHQFSEINADAAYLSQIIPPRGNPLSQDLKERIIKLAQKMQFLAENAPQEIKSDLQVNNILNEFRERITRLLGHTGSYASSSQEVVSADTSIRKNPFLILYYVLRTTTDRLTPNLINILCLPQENLPDGTSSCGFHALKNAYVALAFVTENREETFQNGWCFGSRGTYTTVKNRIAQVLPQKKSDLTRVEIRIAWDALWPNHDDLSIFEVLNSKIGLAAGDAESLTTLLNIRTLVQRPGPFHHAFLIGSHGHWFTMIAEKNTKGNILWYGIDSNANYCQNRFEMALEWIEDACKNVDSIAPRMYHEALGHSIAMRGSKGDPEVLKDPNFIAECKKAVHFMTEMNFLGRQQEPLVRGEVYSLVNVLKHYQKLGMNHPEFDDFLNRYKFEIKHIQKLPAHLVQRERIFLLMQDSQESRDIRSNFDNLSQEDQNYLLRTIPLLKRAKDKASKLTIDVDKVAYQLMVVLKHIPARIKELFMGDIRLSLKLDDYDKPFSTIWHLGRALKNSEFFQPTFREALWKLIEIQMRFPFLLEQIAVDFYDLSCLAQVFDRPAENSVFYEVFSKVTTRRKKYISYHVYENLSCYLRHPANAEFRTNFITYVTGKLRSETDPERLETIYNGAHKHHCKLFTKDASQSITISDYNFSPGSVSDPFVDFLHALVYNGNYLRGWKRDGMQRTPWSIHELIMKHRAKQEPICVAHKVNNRAISISTNNKIIQYYLKDLPDGVNPHTLMSVCAEIKARLNNNPQLAKELLRIASETGIGVSDPDSDTTLEEFQQKLATLYLQRLEFSVIKYPEILEILTLPSNAETPLKRVTFFFYCIIKNRLNLSNSAENGVWSPQEEAFIKMLFMLLTCIQGKNGAICDMYRHECPGAISIEPGQVELFFSRQDEERYDHLIGYTQPLTAEIGKLLEFIHNSFENDHFYYLLRNNVHAKNPEIVIHEQFFIKNMFGSLVNLPWDYTFDWYSDFTLSSVLWNLREPRFLNLLIFLSNQYLKSSTFDSTFNAVWKKINKDIRNDPSRNLATMIMEFIGDDYHSQVFEFTDAPDDDEFIPTINGITESAYIALLIKLGVLRKRENTLKISPSEGLSTHEIIDQVKNALPIESLDLSGHTKLSSSEIVYLIKLCNNLRQLNLSGCTQVGNQELREILSAIKVTADLQVKEIVLKGVSGIHTIFCNPFMPKITLDPGKTIQLLLNQFKTTVSTDNPIDFIALAKDCPEMSFTDLVVSSGQKYHLTRGAELTKIFMLAGMENLDLAIEPIYKRHEKSILDAILKAKYPLKSVRASYFFDLSKTAEVASVFAKLERFSLLESTVDVEVLKPIFRTAHNLQSIEWNYTILPSLNRDGLGRIFDETSPPLYELRNIRIHATQLHVDDIIFLINNSPQLRSIHLDRAMSGSYLPVLNAMNERLTQMENASFATLNLTLDDLSLLATFIKNNPGLKQFSLTNCMCLTGLFLSDIRGAMTNLEHLGIGFVNDSNRNHFQSLILSCPKLQSLDIRGYYQGLFIDIEAALNQMPHLKTLYFDPWFTNDIARVDPGLTYQMDGNVNYLISRFPDRKFIVKSNTLR